MAKPNAMKPLAAYFGREGSLSLTALSQAVGVSKSRLSQLRDSVDWPPQLALDVERVTARAVDAGDLSPVIAAARKGLLAA